MNVQRISASLQKPLKTKVQRSGMSISKKPLRTAISKTLKMDVTVPDILKEVTNDSGELVGIIYKDGVIAYGGGFKLANSSRFFTLRTPKGWGGQPGFEYGIATVQARNLKEVYPRYLKFRRIMDEN